MQGAALRLNGGLGQTWGWLPVSRASGFFRFQFTETSLWAPCINSLKPPCGVLASIYLNFFVAFLAQSSQQICRAAVELSVEYKAVLAHLT